MIFETKKENGFTLLELLVAMTVFSILIFSVSAMIADVFTKSKYQMLSLDNIDHSRLTTSEFVNEIRNSQTGVDGAYSIGMANSSEIIFYSRSASSGSKVNKIHYYLSGTTLYKGVTIPDGNPLAYNSSDETIKIVQEDVVNGDTPLFYYYDGDYNGTTTPLTEPVNLTLIKFVKINLIIKNNVKAGDTSTFLINAGSNIRNLKTNLGD